MPLYSEEDGRFCESDEKETKMKLSIRDGNVLLELSKTTDWLLLPPDLAVSIAQALTEAVAVINQGKH